MTNLVIKNDHTNSGAELIPTPEIRHQLISNFRSSPTGKPVRDRSKSKAARQARRQTRQSK